MAAEVDQGRFLLQAQPPLGQHDHLQRVLPVPLRAATCLLHLPWGAQHLNQVQQRMKDCEGSPGSALLRPEWGSPAEEGLLVAWCWKAVGTEGDKAQGSPEHPGGTGVSWGTPKLAYCKVVTSKRIGSAEDSGGSHTPETLQLFTELVPAAPQGLVWRTPRMGPSSILLLLSTGVGRSPCPRRSLQEGRGHSGPGWELGSASAWARTVSTWAGSPGARAQ